MEAFGAPWSGPAEEFYDPGVAADFVRSLDPKMGPSDVVVSAEPGHPVSWRSFLGEWLCRPGEEGVKLRREPWTHGADSMRWAERLTALDAWETCVDASWMLHAASRAGVPRRLLALAAASIARTALPLVPRYETRPEKAVEMAELWAAGEATDAEVREAEVGAHEASTDAEDEDLGFYAVYAASAAAWAAGVAGREPALRPMKRSRTDAAVAREVYAMRESANDLDSGVPLCPLVRASVPTLAYLEALAGLGRGRGA